jgi:exopolysaccharide biosynthesis polyprenyl glycosylphosphotransferase
MLKEKVDTLRYLHFLTDLVLTLGNLFLSWFFWQQTIAPEQGVTLNQYLWGIALTIAIWSFLLLRNKKCYEYRLFPFPSIVKKVCPTILPGPAFFLFGMLLFSPFPKLVYLVLIFAGLNLLTLLLWRRVILTFLHYFRKKGYNYKNLLIVGTGKVARDFVDNTKVHPEWGIKILGFLDWEEKLKGKDYSGIKVVGGLDELPVFLKNQAIDYVVFAVERKFLNLIEPSLFLCEEAGITTCLLTDFFTPKISFKKSGEIFGQPVVFFSPLPQKPASFFLKILWDKSFALIGIILILPVLCFLTMLIKLTSPGPILFKQKRCGLNGKQFTLFKFRTMIDNAESLKKELLLKNEMKGPVFKIKEDPRITTVGKILRKLSLDELPQLFNVLRGEMSLVGPRPPLPEEVASYDNWHRRKLSMKPGLTCIWQVNGRNSIDFEKWMKLDLEYIDNWSLWLDTKILFQTIPAVLKGTGV